MEAKKLVKELESLIEEHGNLEVRTAPSNYDERREGQLNKVEKSEVTKIKYETGVDSFGEEFKVREEEKEDVIKLYQDKSEDHE